MIHGILSQPLIQIPFLFWRAGVNSRVTTGFFTWFNESDYYSFIVTRRLRAICSNYGKLPIEIEEAANQFEMQE